jgi:hypothetical protein
MMVLMAGNDGYAYMIPEFPPDISFVRMESRAFQIRHGWGTNEYIRKRIYAHKGKLMLWVSADEMKRGENALRFFDLKVLPKTCKNITDNIAETEGDDLFPKTYRFCEVVKL